MGEAPLERVGVRSWSDATGGCRPTPGPWGGSWSRPGRFPGPRYPPWGRRHERGGDLGGADGVPRESAQLCRLSVMPAYQARFRSGLACLATMGGFVGAPGRAVAGVAVLVLGSVVQRAVAGLGIRGVSTVRGIDVLSLPASALDRCNDLGEYWQRHRTMPWLLLTRVIGPHPQSGDALAQAMKATTSTLILRSPLLRPHGPYE